MREEAAVHPSPHFTESNTEAAHAQRPPGVSSASSGFAPPGPPHHHHRRPRPHLPARPRPAPWTRPPLARPRPAPPPARPELRPLAGPGRRGVSAPAGPPPPRAAAAAAAAILTALSRPRGSQRRPRRRRHGPPAPGWGRVGWCVGGVRPAFTSACPRQGVAAGCGQGSPSAGVPGPRLGGRGRGSAGRWLLLLIRVAGLLGRHDYRGYGASVSLTGATVATHPTGVTRRGRGPG